MHPLHKGDDVERSWQSGTGCSSEHSSPDGRREGGRINGRVSDRMVGGGSQTGELPCTPNLKQAVMMVF